MTPPHLPPPETAPAEVRHDLAIAIIAGTAVLALLYLGRAVLVPVTLALILSLAVAPAVRLLRRTGIGQVGAVLIAAAVLTVLLSTLVITIGFQVVQIAGSLPQYESTIRLKARALRELTIGRMETLAGEARKVADHFDADTLDPAEPTDPGALLGRRAAAASDGVVPVEIRAPKQSAYELVGQIAGSVWVPVQTAGIVFVVLLFVLLEHESLRDRFIRLAGGADLRSTTAAINDAGDRLSRFFVSQFAVNIGVGVAVCLALAAIGLPHAVLWGVLTAVLRFVPYVGVIGAALAAGMLAAAVDPGWTLVVETLIAYGVVELIVAQWVEPQLYGHTTGLSPLSIVVAAIFWSWLWGPIGLIVSTPLTLCLVVAGRHFQALGFLDVLLGDAQALTMPQRFYQRALSGDSDEIITAARVFLKRRPFAAYCDQVLMRALALTRHDLLAGTITVDQQHKVRDAIVRVIDALGGETRPLRQRYRRHSVLEGMNAGRQLRQYREESSGQWQGPLSAPPGSVALCIGLGSIGDELATEILVRILRDLHIDARHLTVEDFGQMPPPGATPGSVGMVCIVSLAVADDGERRATLTAEVRRRLPEACLLAALIGADAALDPAPETALDSDLVAGSFEAAAQQAMTRFEGQAQARAAAAA